MKKNVIYAAIAALALVMGSCGGSSKQDAASGSNSAQDSSAASSNVSQKPQAQQSPSIAQMLVGKWQSTINNDSYQSARTIGLARNGKCFIFSSFTETDYLSDGTTQVTVTGAAQVTGRWTLAAGQILQLSMDINSSKIGLRDVSITSSDGTMYTLESYAAMSGESPQAVKNFIREKFRTAFLAQLNPDGGMSVVVKDVNQSECITASGTWKRV